MVMCVCVDHVCDICLRCALIDVRFETVLLLLAAPKTTERKRKRHRHAACTALSLTHGLVGLRLKKNRHLWQIPTHIRLQAITATLTHCHNGLRHDICRAQPHADDNGESEKGDDVEYLE